MSESLSGWLALREAVDHASRSAALTAEVAAALPADRPLRIVDLGSGTGSNVRYLSPRLPAPQRWLLVDRDASLLARAGARAGAEFHTKATELGNLDEAIVAGAHLVTASALLDLVSDRWLRDLASACRRHRAVALFALSYNGRSTCNPPEPEDEQVRELFNAHQRQSDKGFGTAAGPDAVEQAVAAFGQAAYLVSRAATDWILLPEMRTLQTQLIAGWAEAAAEMAPGQSTLISKWHARRISHVDAGRSTIVVGHDDVAAIPV